MCVYNFPRFIFNKIPKSLQEIISKMDVSSLDGMKRAELQKLAKQAGIKANKKTGHLISELKKYYTKNNNAEEDTSSKTDPDASSSSQTETCTTTEFETATESDVEVKPKVTRGRRGRKAAGRKKKTSDSEVDTTIDEEPLTQPPTEELKQEVVEADTETPSPPKRTTRAKRGRRGRKRASTPLPTKEATPAKIAKASPVQKKVVTPKSATPAAVKEHTKPVARTTPKPETTTATAKATPHNEVETVPAARGSSTRRARRKVATPVVVNPTPTEAKKTPAVADTETTKPATRGSSGRKTSKRRRSTFEIDPVTGTPKPSAQEKVEEVKVESDPEMEKVILAELEKKVEDQKPKQPTTRIPKPRFGKPVTPGNKNWAKIHAARMEKMESIDDYLSRKRKRTENLNASVKRAKVVAEEAKAAMETLKAHRTPPVKGKQGPKIIKPIAKPGVNFMSPRPTSKPVKGCKSGVTASFSSPAFKGTASKTPAAPNTAVKSVSFKVSKLKTPKPALPGKTSCKKRISTPGPNRSLSQSGRKSVGDAAEKRKSLMASARKSIGNGNNQRKSLAGGATPFKFGETQLNTTTPAKKSFDIKASLSKGLTYKPYTGKLKPLGEINYPHAKPKSGVSNAKVHLKMHANVTKAKAELKKPKVTSREERRAGAIKHRAGKRDNNMMARRGIKM